MVAIDNLRLGDSPRVHGVDFRHVRELVEAGKSLPPIVVNRKTMEVIDGSHRIMAARQRGELEISVSFFDGSEKDAFLLAVYANAEQGLPLSREDRSAATRRILDSHEMWSDRMIAELVGLSTKTVASIRKCSTESEPQLNKRLGRDGKMRPVDSTNARRRAIELFKSNPNSSLREVARAVGLSPATVKDVKMRMSYAGSATTSRRDISCATDINSVAAVDALLNNLRRDPAIISNENGRAVLRLLVSAVEQRRNMQYAHTIPAHQVSAVIHIAKACSDMWQDLATQLASRDV
ncbi:ParB/RepB/Spo0J family partition protein [Nocardia fluminea]|uniref:ParB/RepB/Spo0J family partition protein n=1 Tax=Nocardia fluminea TaxID=134984 RepID=UPI00343BFFBC